MSLFSSRCARPASPPHLALHRLATYSPLQSPATRPFQPRQVLCATAPRFSRPAHFCAPLPRRLSLPHDPALRQGVRPSTTMSDNFPHDKLQPLRDAAREPLILVSCGSFSPITYLHLRMFEMVKDWVKENTQFEVVGGFLSPVSDAYKKVGLATAKHRIAMCRLATENSSWIMVDGWEASKSEYTRTALVLDHFEEEINGKLGGIEGPDGSRRPAKICLMSGADLIETMSVPGVWSEQDLDHILGKYGAFIIERMGTDLEKALSNLAQWKSNIYPIPQLIQNDVSSTKVRQFLRKDMSIRYLIPEPALRYIDELGLFKEESPPRSPGSQSPSIRGVPNGSSVDGTKA